MKTKLLSTIAIVAFLASCSSSKKAVVETKPEVVEVEKVELTTELAAGKTIFENKCGRCHDLPEPSHYTKEKWLPIVTSMAKKAKISDSDKDLVYNYLTANL